MAKGIIKQIFIDHWDGFTKEYGKNIRESIFHEVKKMIRYYGIYARNNKYKNKFFKLVNEKIAMELKKLRKWEYRLLKAFGIDPLKCEKCGSTMHLDGIYFNKSGNLIEKYKRDLLNKVKLKVEELRDMNASVKVLSPLGMGALFAE